MQPGYVYKNPHQRNRKEKADNSKSQKQNITDRNMPFCFLKTPFPVNKIIYSRRNCVRKPKRNKSSKSVLLLATRYLINLVKTAGAAPPREVTLSKKLTKLEKKFLFI